MFDDLLEYAKVSVKKKEASVEKPHPILDLFLLLGLEIGESSCISSIPP